MGSFLSFGGVLYTNAGLTRPLGWWGNVSPSDPRRTRFWTTKSDIDLADSDFPIDLSFFFLSFSGAWICSIAAAFGGIFSGIISSFADTLFCFLFVNKSLNFFSIFFCLWGFKLKSTSPLFLLCFNGSTFRFAMTGVFGLYVPFTPAYATSSYSFSHQIGFVNTTVFRFTLSISSAGDSSLFERQRFPISRREARTDLERRRPPCSLLNLSRRVSIALLRVAGHAEPWALHVAIDFAHSIHSTIVTWVARSDVHSKRERFAEWRG